MAIVKNNMIDTYFELLVIFLLILAFLMILFKIGNWLEKRPIKEKKSKKKNKEEPKKSEEVTKTPEKTEEKAQPIECKPAKFSNGNYLYDRFVENPTIEDNIKKKPVSDAFISEKELQEIRERDIRIKVNDVEDLSEKSNKSLLMQKLGELTSDSKETREKLLEEFEGLSREMKLLLIENIITKR